MNIQYLKGADIDKVKWNSCVHYANNGNIFGYMWYLDFVAKDWDALVEGDYESVFPLVWKEGLFGRKELYQPNLMREMGIYSIHLLSPARIRAFLDAIPPEFKRINIAVNEQNTPPAGSPFEVVEKTNHQLYLGPSYEEMFDGFSGEMASSLQRAEDQGLILTSSLKPETVAEFYRRHTPAYPGLESDYHALHRIMYNVLHRGWGFASGAMDREQNLYAANFFIYSHGKVLSLAPAQSPAGAELGALPYLFNALIRSHAGRPLILDFNVRGGYELARQFGAQPNAFYQLKKDKRILGLI
ncbi:MAG: hypothetical protein KDD10_08500 [Phaeodactylibacter sp.]|nr:hypothetical protein [Phaeodactylibacter sp.]MCB9292985.1 hypothetical protein [Lewinellaceae bacterium]